MRSIKNRLLLRSTSRILLPTGRKKGRMNKKDQLLLWLLSLAVWGFLIPIRAYGFYWATIAHSIAFAILTWWSLRKYAPKAGLWCPLKPMLAPWLFELALRCFLSDSILSTPTTIMPLWAVITIALFYCYRKTWFLLVSGALWLFGLTEGQKQWYEWIRFGDKPILTVNLADCEVSDSTHTFRLSEVKSDYLVLDVWYSACGVCINQMPDVQALHDEYKDSNIEVVSLFACLLKGETVSDGYRIVNERGCDIPVYTIDENSLILKRCEIDKYPRVLILDKNRTVIFNGSLEFAKRKLKKL